PVKLARYRPRIHPRSSLVQCHFPPFLHHHVEGKYPSLTPVLELPWIRRAAAQFRYDICQSYISPSCKSCALSCNTPAVIDEFFDVAWVEPQRTPPGPHLHGWQILLPLAGCLLGDR